VQLPPLPAECRQRVPHADLTIGGSPVVALKRERAQLDLANGVIVRCGAFYVDLKSGLEGR
jgi:hypothetical protein